MKKPGQLEVYSQIDSKPAFMNVFDNDQLLKVQGEICSLNHINYLSKNSTNYCYGQKSIQFIRQPATDIDQANIIRTGCQFQKFSFSDKINFLQILVMKLQKQIKIHGYFHITQPMIQCDLKQPLIGEVAFFAKQKIIKPIHPIKRKTKIEEELQFINSLKKTLKRFFPTVDLGTRKTIYGLYHHLSSLKSPGAKPGRSYRLSACKSISQFQNNTSDEQNQLTLSSTTQLKVPKQKYFHQKRDQAKRMSVTNKYQSNALSSRNDCKRSLYLHKQSPDMKSKTEQFLGKQVNHISQSFIQNQEQQRIQDKNEKVRTSVIIQNQINELFKSSMDLKQSGLYNESKDKNYWKITKKDTLDRVIEDFEELF